MIVCQAGRDTLTATRGAMEEALKQAEQRHDHESIMEISRVLSAQIGKCMTVQMGGPGLRVDDSPMIEAG